MSRILNGTVVSMTLAVGLAVGGCGLSNDNQPTGATIGGATTGGVTSRGGTEDMGDPVDSGMTGIGGDFDGDTGAPMGGGR